MDGLVLEGEVWHWKGPAPHHFVTVPAALCEALRSAASLVSYGWGTVPVRVSLGGSTWETALFPKEGRYLVPLRADVRRREGVSVGDAVTLTLEVMAESPARARARRSAP